VETGEKPRIGRREEACRAVSTAVQVKSKTKRVVPEVKNLQFRPWFGNLEPLHDTDLAGPRVRQQTMRNTMVGTNIESAAPPPRYRRRFPRRGRPQPQEHLSKKKEERYIRLRAREEDRVVCAIREGMSSSAKCEREPGCPAWWLDDWKQVIAVWARHCHQNLGEG